MSLKEDDQVFKPSALNTEVILNQDSLHLFISLRSQHVPGDLGGRDDRNDLKKDAHSSLFFNPEEVRLATESSREELVRMYFMGQVPATYSELGLVFKDSFSGLFYLEILFTSRGQKEAFYNTHRMIRGISRLSINEALHRLESQHLPKDKSKGEIKVTFRIF